VIIPPALLLNHLLNTCPALIDDSILTNLNKDAETEYHLAGRWIYTFIRRVDVFFYSPTMMHRSTCEIFIWHPVLCVHLFYFVFVDVGFYFIYVFQSSTWLIDPHWQILPMCMSVFYFLHPNANEEDTQHSRAVLTLCLVFLWGVRLLHNYFRRENWHLGLREDWRYANMRQQHGSMWIISQFFAVSLAQHGMLVGLCLPLSEAMKSSGAPFGWIDIVATLLCCCGIVCGFVADNQLYEYMNMENKPILLETGLWKWSRHPNHFGEQTWWLGLLLFGISSVWETNGFSLATFWPISFGVLFNHPLDVFVTLPLIEKRMLGRAERAAVYKDYQKRTSLIVPFPPLPKSIYTVLKEHRR
jgi:steroid 5-alpha reductase family enzyme